MHRPVCAECRVEMRPSLNGVAFLNKTENFSTGEVYGYELHQGDEWQCPGCMHRIISGWGRNPITQHYADDFDTVVEAYRVADNTDGLFVEENYELSKRTAPFSLDQLREKHDAGSDT